MDAVDVSRPVLADQNEKLFVDDPGAQQGGERKQPTLRVERSRSGLGGTTSSPSDLSCRAEHGLRAGHAAKDGTSGGYFLSSTSRRPSIRLVTDIGPAA
jgi:hypothetical protein